MLQIKEKSPTIFLIIYSSFSFSSQIFSQIHILCTAALIENQYEERKTEYINNLKKLAEFGYAPYVIESCTQGPTFLDDYSNRVFYTKTNNPTLKNKGVNEILSLVAAFSQCKFNENDMIIKITGRYYLESPYFIKMIENNPQLDIFVTKINNFGQIFTGCFAMRYHHFKLLLENIDLNFMEKNMKNFEKIVVEYIQNIEKFNAKICYLDSLGISARIGNNKELSFF